MIEELLKQEPQFSIPPDVQILMLSLVFTGFFDTKDMDFVKSQKEAVIKTLESPVFKPLLEATKTVKLDELISSLKGQLKPLEDVASRSPEPAAAGNGAVETKLKEEPGAKAAGESTPPQAGGKDKKK